MRTLLETSDAELQQEREKGRRREEAVRGADEQHARASAALLHHTQLLHAAEARSQRAVHLAAAATCESSEVAGGMLAVEQDVERLGQVLAQCHLKLASVVAAAAQPST